MAIAYEGDRGRIYIEPSDSHGSAASVERPDGSPAGELAENRGQTSHFMEWSTLRICSRSATRRLGHLLDLVGEASVKVREALASGLSTTADVIPMPWLHTAFLVSASGPFQLAM